MLGTISPAVYPTGSQRISSESEISTAIRKASAESGSPFELLMASAQMESGLRSDAKASTSSATGLFQFTEQTWLDAVRRHGAEHGMAGEASAIIDQGGRLSTADPELRQRILNLRTDPSVASALAADHMQDLSATLSAGLGRAATAGEVYLGHFLGAHGAQQIISAPQNQPAANLLPEAARANTRLFYAPDGTPYTAAQFLQQMHTRLNQAVADLGSATPGGAMQSADGAGTVNANPSATAGTSSLAASLPHRILSVPERQAMASLMAPLLQLDQYDSGLRARRARRDATALAATLAALQTTTS